MAALWFPVFERSVRLAGFVSNSTHVEFSSRVLYRHHIVESCSRRDDLSLMRLEQSFSVFEDCEVKKQALEGVAIVRNSPVVSF